MSHIDIPFWERMLFIPARSTDMTGLGYLGVDLVTDGDKGPLLLELNARPGLRIQIANRKGLLRHLEKIDEAPIEVFSTLEKRVAYATEHFAESVPSMS